MMTDADNVVQFKSREQIAVEEFEEATRPGSIEARARQKLDELCEMREWLASAIRVAGGECYPVVAFTNYADLDAKYNGKSYNILITPIPDTEGA